MSKIEGFKAARAVAEEQIVQIRRLSRPTLHRAGWISGLQHLIDQIDEMIEDAKLVGSASEPIRARSGDPVDDCAAVTQNGAGRCIEPGVNDGLCDFHAPPIGGR